MNVNYSSLISLFSTLQLPNDAVARSRPSSTNSYKSKDFPDAKPAEASNRPANSENLIEKGDAIDGKAKPPAQNVTQVTKDLDYKKMYEDLMVEFENFKTEVNKKEQDYLRGKGCKSGHLFIYCNFEPQTNFASSRPQNNAKCSGRSRNWKKSWCRWRA